MMFQWRVIMDWCRSVYLAEKSKISTSLNKIKRLHLCMGVCVCACLFLSMCAWVIPTTTSSLLYLLMSAFGCMS